MSTAILRNEFSPLDVALATADAQREALELLKQAVLDIADGKSVPDFYQLCFQTGTTPDAGYKQVKLAVDRKKAEQGCQARPELEKKIAAVAAAVAAAEENLVAANAQVEREIQRLRQNIVEPARKQVETLKQEKQELRSKLRECSEHEKFLWLTADPAIDEQARAASDRVRMLQSGNVGLLGLTMSNEQRKKRLEECRAEIERLGRGEIGDNDKTWASEESKAEVVAGRVQRLRQEITVLERDIETERNRPALVKAAQAHVAEILKQKLDWRKMRWQ